jgi:N-acetylneuraminic acid mutarotase
MRRYTKFIFSLLLIFPILFAYSHLTVEADITTWPEARAGHSMIYASNTEEIILFGGMRDNINIASSYLNDTWKYNYPENRWTKLNPITGPSGRSSPGMVYDPINDRVILFGGITYNQSFNDTWELDIDTYEWRKIETLDAPIKVADPEMVFDEINQEIVLFGGYINQGYFDETWTFGVDSNIWNKLTVSTHPSSRYGHRMIYSNFDDEIYLFGGHAFNGTDTINHDMWSYDCSSRTWSEIPSSIWPSSRYWHGLTYDSVYERIVLFGGRVNSWSMDCWGDTWGYDLDSSIWSEIPATNYPPARMYFPMVYHSAEEKTILFGGCQDPNIVIFSDMWSFDYQDNKWVEINPDSIHTRTSYIHAFLFLSFLSIISIIGHYFTKRK